MISLIVACDEARGIGYKNQIPWFIPGELAWVRKTTQPTDDPAKQNALIMGYQTWLSLPESRRPLPGRRSIVLSRMQTVDIQGVETCRSLEDAFALAQNDPAIERIFVFGGASVYAEALNKGLVDEVLISLVPGQHTSDAFFPELPDDFSLQQDEPTQYGEIVVRHQLWRRGGAQ